MSAVARLALRRAWTTPGRWLPVALPVALAVALFAALTGAGVVAGDHAAHRALAALPAKERAAVLSYNGGAEASTDADARRRLAAMGGGPVSRGILLVAADFGRTIVRMAGIAPVAPAVRLLSGRLPQGECTAGRCEVLHVSGEAPPTRRLTDRGLHLVVVGRGLITDPTVLGFSTRRADFALDGARHQPALLLSRDPAGVDGLAPLGSLSRTHDWSAPLPLEDLRSWEIDGLVRRIAAERARIDAATGGFTVTSPLAALQGAEASSRRAPGRLATAGAAAAAALAAFLVLAAAGLRSGLLAEDGRLRRAGATTGQRAVLAVTETGVPVAAGVLTGLLLGGVAAVLRGAAGDVDGGHVLREAAGAAAGTVALVAAAGWALVLLTARAPASAARPLLGAGLVAAGALLAGLLVPQDTGGADPLPGAVIPVAGAAAGLLVALLLPAVLRRVARRGGVSMLELARRPGPATIAAAGLAVSVGLAGFAFAYRATLDRSRDDQADARVPLAATVLPGADLRSPLAVRPLASWEQQPGVKSAVPVVRRDAFVLAGPQRSPATLFGLPADVTGELAAWRPGDAGGDRAQLAGRLTAPPFDRGPAGAPIPAGDVTLRASADGDRVAVTLLVRTPGGTIERVALGLAGRTPATLRAHAPEGSLVGLELNAETGLLLTRGHQAAEGGGGVTAAGTLMLGGLRAGGAAIPLASWAPHGEGLRGHGGRLAYHLAGPAVLRPGEPSDDAALPVLADPETAHDAAIADEVELDVLGVRVRAEVVGIVRRFPTIPAGRSIVLADQAALTGALDAQLPGAGEPRELWLDGGAPRPVAGLVVQTHRAVAAEIGREPVSSEVLGALTAAALLAALLAVAGVAVAVRRALRDDALALADLEAQGTGPAALRRGLRSRGAAIAVTGVVPGVLLALVLTRLVTAAVRAGADGAPDPPLVAVVPWGMGALAALLLLVAAAAAGAAAAAPALREDTPATVPDAEAA